MDLGIRGRVALVTGASKGIGRAIAGVLAAEGARVAVASRDRARIDEAAGATGAAAAFTYDSGVVGAGASLVEAVASALGPVEILVSNTGGPPAGAEPGAFTREQWTAVYQELMLAPLELVEAALPAMRERRWGRILNVGSTSVLEPIPHLMLSNAHRAGAAAMLKTVSRQVAADGVTVNTLITGRIRTDRLLELYGSGQAADDAAHHEVPAGRLGSVEEIADVAAFLCSDRASYVTGAAVPVDGGLLRGV